MMVIVKKRSRILTWLVVLMTWVFLRTSAQIPPVPVLVPIDAGGIEIFPEPDRQSGRLFAIRGDFHVFLVGQSDDGNFFYIYYFERGKLKDGWTRLDQVKLDNLTRQDFDGLMIAEPDNLPPIPTLPYTPLAERYSSYEPTPQDLASIAEYRIRILLDLLP